MTKEKDSAEILRETYAMKTPETFDFSDIRGDSVFEMNIRQDKVRFFSYFRKDKEPKLIKSLQN